MSDLSGFSLYELFRAEVETHCAALSDGLIKLERAPTDLEVIVPLMRAAHSVKGAARIVGVDAAVAVAHHMEDALVRMQKGTEHATRARIDQLLAGTDLLERIARVAEGDAAEWVAKHTSEIESLTAALSAPPTESAHPTAAAARVVEGQASASSIVAAPAPREPESSPPVASEIPGVQAGEAKLQPTNDGGDARTVRVNAENLDRMMQLAGESMVEGRRSPALRRNLAALRGEVRRLRGLSEEMARRGRSNDGGELSEVIDAIEAGLVQRIAELEAFFRRTEEVSTALYHEVIGSRMRPFREGVAGFPRLVRDLSRQLGKDAHLDVVGGQVPVDRDILAKLEAPLNHIIRNALDHGVETPEQRIAAGKPAQARIVVEARHQAGQLVVLISDDGKGISLERVRERIVARGMQSKEVAARLGDRELYEFLFLPGFSTAPSVTEVSGRGVGLDVVHQMVTSTAGTVRLESRPGVGTTFSLTLPVTLSVLRAALVDIDGEPYAFPLARIERVLRAEHDDITSVQGRLQCLVDDEAIGLLDARSVLGFAAHRIDGRVNIVLLGDEHGSVGLVVGRFLGEQDLVVRHLDRRLGKVPHVSAAAILDDGSPALIIDVEDMLATLRKGLTEGSLRGLAAGSQGDGVAERPPKRVLVVDDSITVREVERQLLLRMGYEVAVAVDGVDGWNQLRAGGFDLLVTDIDMPRMNGIDLVKTVRADPRFTHLPIAVVSYKDREEDRRAGLDAGANAYLTKSSFHDQTFVATVTDLVGAP